MNQHTRAEAAPIPFIDVAAQRRRLGRTVDDAVARVLGHCQFILGPEVRAVEADLAAFCGARHAITCASGTDALLLPLMAKGLKAGHAVICPSYTFCATAEMVALVGATPVFADVDAATFNLDPRSVERAIVTARRLGLEPKAIIPVDLFGQAADHQRARRHRAGRETVRAGRRRAGLRGDPSQPPARDVRRRDRDQLLSGQAVVRLRRRRRGVHR